MICICAVHYYGYLGKTDPQIKCTYILYYWKIDKRSESLISVHTISLTDILANK